MSTLDSLNPGQRAVLELLLAQGKSYDDLAVLLKTASASVRDRAHAAIDALAGSGVAEISPSRRNEIADYLLGQQTASQRAATREYLEGSAAGRAWARAASSALRPIAAADALPDVPAEREEVAEAFDALDKRAARRQEVTRSSQLGGRLLAVGAGLVVAITIILVLNLTGGDDEEPAGAATTPVLTTPATTTPATGTTGDPDTLALAVLQSPSGSESPSRGEAGIFRYPEGDRYRLLVDATKLPPSSSDGSGYGVWLYSSADTAEFVGFPDTPVGSDGHLQALAELTPTTPRYDEVLITREPTTDREPTRPGTVLLRGRLITADQLARRQGTTTTP